MIILNDQRHDDRQELPPQLRLRIEMLVLTLEDIQAQRRCIDLKNCKFLSLSEVEKLIATMNKAYHYLHEVQLYIDQELRVPC